MAYIDTQDPNQDPNNPQNQAQTGQAPATGGQSSQVAGGSGGTASAGVGPGGTGGWTNIQSYLDANKGDNGSAGALTKTVGDQFSNERSAMNTDAQNYLSDAQTSAKSNQISNDQADQYTDQASREYQYPGETAKRDVTPNTGTTTGYQQKVTPGASTGQTDPQATADQGDYSSIVGKFQHALNDPYSGPTNYNYGISADTQNRGAQLKDDGQFDTLMNNVYSNAAQKPLTSGQFQLQKQLDVNNQGLQDARSNLGGQYDSLLSDRDKTVGDTTTALTGIAQDYGKSQNALRDYLSGKETGIDSAIGKAQGDARTAYQNSYANDNLGAIGGFGEDPTAANLQNYENTSNLYNAWKHGDQSGPVQGHASTFQQIDPELQGFYNAQDQKYADAGDPENRQFNSIQDFLGLTGNAKKQGFQVRS